MNEPVHVRYNAGQAVVRVGHAELTVEPRDSQQRSALCPVELVSAALGT